MSSINYAETRVQRVQVPVQVPVLKPVYVEVPYPVYVPVPGPNRWPMALQDPHFSQQIMQQTPLDQQYDLIWVPDEDDQQYQQQQQQQYYEPVPRQQQQRQRQQYRQQPRDQAAQTEPDQQIFQQPIQQPLQQTQTQPFQQTLQQTQQLNQTIMNQTIQTQHQSQRPSRPYKIFDEPMNSTQQPQQIINKSDYLRNSKKPIIYNKEPTVTDPNEILSRVGLPNDIAQSQFVNSAAFLRPSATKN